MENKIYEKVKRMHKKVKRMRYENWRKSLEKEEELKEESYKKFDTCKYRGRRDEPSGLVVYSYPYCKERSWTGLSLKKLLMQDGSELTSFKPNFQPGITCGKCRRYEEMSEVDLVTQVS